MHLLVLHRAVCDNIFVGVTLKALRFCVFSASTSSSLTPRSATIFWEFGTAHPGHQTVGSCWKSGPARLYLKISTQLSTYWRCSLILITSSASKDFLYSSLVSRFISKNKKIPGVCTMILLNLGGLTYFTLPDPFMKKSPSLNYQLIWRINKLSTHHT